MRSLCFFLVLSFAATASLIAGDEWYRTQAPTRRTLRDVALQNNHFGYAVGDSATVVRTSDGGLHWDTQIVVEASLLTNSNLLGVSMLSNGQFVAAGEHGRIVRGKDIFLRASITNEGWTFNDVTFMTEAAVVAVGKDSAGKTLIARSTDTGATFKRIITNETETVLSKVQFFNPSLGFAVGSRPINGVVGMGVVLRTEDGGRTWDTVLTARNVHFMSLALSGGDILCTGVTEMSNGAIYRSQNAGTTWTMERHPDMSFVTDIIGMQGADVYMVGYRFNVVNNELFSFASAFRSTDGGVNWGATDFGDGLQGIFRVSATADRMVMVGDSGRVWVRWYTPTPPISDVRAGIKHIEFGTVVTSTAADTVVREVLFNTSTRSRRIVRMEITDPHSEFTLTESYNGRDLEPGATLDAAIRFTPTTVGEHWALLFIQLDNLQEFVIHLSGTEGVATTNHIVVQQRYYDFGDVSNPFGVFQNIQGVFRNTDTTTVSVTNIQIEDGDGAAFSIVDSEQPMDIAPNEEFNLDLLFQPKARGIYRVTLLISVADTQIRIPVVGSSRLEGYLDVVDFGDVHVDSTVTMPIEFSADVWQDWFNVIVFNEPGLPFTITDVHEDRENSVIADVSITPTTTGPVVAPLFGSWSFGDSRISWIQRLVVRMNGSDRTTSVDEHDQRSSLSVAPQPASSSIRVILPVALHMATIDVLDVQGRTCTTHAVPASDHGIDMQLDIQSLDPGAYLLIVRSGHTSYSKTILKQ